MGKYQKGRDWAFVVYPESVNVDWLNILQETKLQIAISPLHNMDLNPDGIKKKSHWHVLIRYDGPTTFNHVKELSDRVGGTCPIRKFFNMIKGRRTIITNKNVPMTFLFYSVRV